MSSLASPHAVASSRASEGACRPVLLRHTRRLTSTLSTWISIDKQPFRSFSAARPVSFRYDPHHKHLSPAASGFS